MESGKKSACPENPTMKFTQYLICFSFLFLFTGCRILPCHDQLVIRAEQSIRFAYVATDSFLKFEYDNRAQYPTLKPMADRIRLHAPVVLNQAWEAVKTYKKSRTKVNQDILIQYVAVIETLTRDAQAAMANLATP